MQEFMRREMSPITEGQGIESQETHEFSVEEIQQVLKNMDGQEHPDLMIGEKIENIKGELTSMIFNSNEMKFIEGANRRISYSLNLAGQRYKTDGTPGRLVSRTFLTKDYDEAEFYVEDVAEYIDGTWVLSSPAV